MSATSSSLNPHFVFVQKLLEDKTGFVLDDDKEYLLDTRLAGVLSRFSMPSLAAVVAALRSDGPPGLERAVIEAVLNGETSFFRDPAFFDVLRDKVLPALIASRGGDRVLRLWSTSCATGQEPYSLAMLLEERFPLLEGWDVSILATDVSAYHLRRAQAGTYTQFEVNRGLPASLLVKYFDQRGSEWHIAPSLQRRVTFQEMNLIEPWFPLPKMDIVLIRNVMIYWKLERRKDVLDRIGRQLRPGGCVVMGSAETPHFLDDRYEPFGEGTTCCYRLRPEARASGLP